MEKSENQNTQSQLTEDDKLEFQGYKEYHQKEGLHEGQRIYLQFTEPFYKVSCALSGEIFEREHFLGFFLNNDEKLPVKPQIAFDKGFIMTDREFYRMERAVSNSLSIVNGEGISVRSERITVNFPLISALKMCFGLAQLTANTNKSSVKFDGSRELFEFLERLKNSVFHVLRDSVRDFDHFPIFITEDLPVSDNSLPF